MGGWVGEKHLREFRAALDVGVAVNLRFVSYTLL